MNKNKKVTKFEKAKESVDNKKNVVSDEQTKTPLEQLKEFSGDDTVKQIESLTDEELNKIIGGLSINDNSGRTIIFSNKDEAIIYATQLQKNIKEIRFCKLVECYSIYIGVFWLVEPMGTNFADNQFKEDETLYGTSSDFVLCSSIVLSAIIERAKRDKLKLDNEKVKK